jgi:hypothetical protein
LLVQVAAGSRMEDLCGPAQADHPGLWLWSQCSWLGKTIGLQWLARNFPREKDKQPNSQVLWYCHVSHLWGHASQ